MSRGDRWASAASAAAALALGGCMRIYPDPELPDVEVGWPTALECAEDRDDRVVVSLFADDPAVELGPVTAPCRDGRVRFDDVARLRYRLAARIEDAAGAVLGAHDEELDLRDGISERVFAYFGRAAASNFRVAWTFDMGASCDSLAVTSVLLRASVPGGGSGGGLFFFDAPCDAPVFMNEITVSGTYTLTARAISDDVAVAASAASPPFTITSGMVTDLGTITLSPCGAACPTLGPE